MPNKTSAKKELRKSRAKRVHNRTLRSSLRTTLKKFRETVAAGDPTATETAFRLAVKHLDQAAAKNLIHPNAAARTKSRLSKLCPRRNAAAPA